MLPLQILWKLIYLPLRTQWSVLWKVFVSNDFDTVVELGWLFKFWVRPFLAPHLLAEDCKLIWEAFPKNKSQFSVSDCSVEREKETLYLYLSLAREERTEWWRKYFIAVIMLPLMDRKLFSNTQQNKNIWFLLTFNRYYEGWEFNVFWHYDLTATFPKKYKKNISLLKSIIDYSQMMMMIMVMEKLTAW